MSSEAISAEIERVAQRRHAAWRGEFGDGFEVPRLTAQLHDLYEERRIEDARKRSGNRSEIARRAKVETELERLMTN